MTMDGRNGQRAATLGLRVRSGRAIAVLLAGSADRPELVDTRLVRLSDPAVPASVQPYHAALVQHQLREMRKAERLVSVVRQFTDRSVNELLDLYRDRGYTVCRTALVVGSLIDPETVRNQHMRAHALEGRLFRVVLEEAVTAAGLGCRLILERDAYSEGAAALSRAADALKRAVTDMGRSWDGSWRADEKLATVAAWIELGRTADVMSR